MSQIRSFSSSMLSLSSQETTMLLGSRAIRSIAASSAAHDVASRTLERDRVDLAAPREQNCGELRALVHIETLDVLARAENDVDEVCSMSRRSSDAD